MTREDMRRAAAIMVSDGGDFAVDAVKVFKAIDSGELAEAHRLLLLVQGKLAGQYLYVVNLLLRNISEHARGKAGAGPIEVVRY